MFDTTELGTPGASAAALLESIDPRALADLDLVAYAQAAERQVAHATALSLRASLLVAGRAQARLLGEIDRADQDLGRADPGRDPGRAGPPRRRARAPAGPAPVPDRGHQPAAPRRRPGRGPGPRRSPAGGRALTFPHIWSSWITPSAWTSA